MKKHCLFLAAACGACAGLSGVAHGQTVINISGATLLRNFLIAQASTNDYIDADGNGTARRFGTNQQLAPTFSGGPVAPPAPWCPYVMVTPCPAPIPLLTCPPPPACACPWQWWNVSYRVTGSVNGLQELIDYGRAFTTDAPPTGLAVVGVSQAYYNRDLYINNEALTGIGNAGNPGGSPVRSDMSTLQATYSPPPMGSAGGIKIDVAALDVPSRWAVFTAGPTSADRRPGQAGYGFNQRRSVNKQGGTAGANLPNSLANLGTANLYDPASPCAADCNTLFDTPIVWAPIAPITNLGTGVRQLTTSELRHLVTTGRLVTGENLMMVTRDSGSGTRNGYMNSICADPSFGVGENIGPLNGNATTTDLAGPNFLPSNKSATANVANTVQNTRLGVGYIGAETAINSPSWGSGGRLEIIAVRNDLAGGTEYSRPTISDILFNDANGWVIGGPAAYSTFGDPRATGASNGGYGFAVSDVAPACLTPMRNVEAAKYINNITRSVAAFISAPGGSDTLFTPGEFLATNFILSDATSFVPNPNDPCARIPNPTLNPALRTYTGDPAPQGANSVYRNNFYTAFGTVTLNGKNPTRQTGTVYSDGVPNGGNFVNQGGANVGYGSNAADRNRISGDFDGNGLRNVNDACDLVRAWRQRTGGPAWTAPTGTGPIAGAPGTDAVIEILGDFNGDGNFNGADLRYWADGLAIDPATGKLNRAMGFTALDNCLNGQTGDNNLFDTVLAHGAYAPGASRADVSGPTSGHTIGFAPIGQDGVVNGFDIDYVYGQFKRNANVTDGALNWDNLHEAIDGDLSCDITGDLIVDQADVLAILAILNTTMGDVNLDGVVNGSDCLIATQHLTQSGGWAQGDVDGDGVITTADLAIICGTIDCNGNGQTPDCFNPANGGAAPYATGGADQIDDDCQCVANWNRDGEVNSNDVTAYLNAWTADQLNGTLTADIGNGAIQLGCDGETNSNDIALFLNLWFSGLTGQGGCPQP